MTEQKHVSSIKSIERTIHNDYQTYHWFLYLVTRDSVLKTRPGLNIRREPQQLLSTLETQQLITLLSLPILALLSFFKVYILLWIFLPVGTYLFFLHQKKKQLTAHIAKALILNDFPDGSYQTKTLYQLGEHFSRKDNVPSLVDTIFTIDRIVGAVVIAIFSVATIIFPSSTPRYIAGCIATYCLGIFAANRFIFYRTIR